MPDPYINGNAIHLHPLRDYSSVTVTFPDRTMRKYDVPQTLEIPVTQHGVYWLGVIEPYPEDPLDDTDDPPEIVLQPGREVWLKLEPTATQTRDAERAEMSVDVDIFADNCAEDGVVSEPELLAWLAAGTLPDFVENALARIANLRRRRRFRFKIVAARTVHRISPIVALIQQAKGLTDEQVDALFRLPNDGP